MNSPATNSVTMETELLRLVYGRLDPDHTPPILLTGDLTLDDLRQVFPGF